MTKECVNLALLPGVCVSVSARALTGGAARDASVLLNETAHHVDGAPLDRYDRRYTYDTYDGQNAAPGPDWYAIEFPAPLTCNSIEFTMGLPYRDGGWWTSLALDVRDEHNTWSRVALLSITPAYNFTDTRAGRRPFEHYALTFAATTCTAVRLIGQGGGVAQFTSLARLAVYQRNLAMGNPGRVPPPTPALFRILHPHTIWDVSEGLMKLTGLSISFPLMEYYLDETRYQQCWQRMRRNYEGEPELWFVLGEAIGWVNWNAMAYLEQSGQAVAHPYVHVLLDGSLAVAVAPVVVNGQFVGAVSTSPVVLRDGFDAAKHHAIAERFAIPWPRYSAALARSIDMSYEQLVGAASILGTLTTTIADLAHRNDLLEHALATSGNRKQHRRTTVQWAIAFMHEHLEGGIDVADVAQAVALSAPYFCALFTEQTGQNPRDYLIDLRLERAKDYLVADRLSVLEVCAALGYSPNYFSRLFKERIGEPPSAYARRMRSETP